MMSASEAYVVAGSAVFWLAALASLAVWLIRDMAELREFRRSMRTNRERESDGRSDESLTAARKP
jgi:hypothetical protein